MTKSKRSRIKKVILVIIRLNSDLWFAMRVHFKKDLKISLFYTLSKEQISDFVKTIQENEFKKQFNIQEIRDSQVFVIHSESNSLHYSKNGLIIQTRHPILILGLNILPFLLLNALRKNLLFIKPLVNSIKTEGRFKEVMKQRISNHLICSYDDLHLFTTISSLGLDSSLFKIEKEKRNYKTYMLHYAQNTLPPVKNKDSFKIAKFLVNELIDTHIVWTKEYADVLSTQNKISTIRCVGPILFKLNELNPRVKQNRFITIFDVTISSDKKYQNFYDEKLGREFLSDIISSFGELNLDREIKLVLKPKREIVEGKYSKLYLKEISESVDSGRIELLPHDIDIFKLIKSSMVCISIPFTSTAIIASQMSIPSVFYYPFTDIELNNIYEKNIELLQGRDKLQSYFHRHKLNLSE